MPADPTEADLLAEAPPFVQACRVLDYLACAIRAMSHIKGRMTATLGEDLARVQEVFARDGVAKNPQACGDVKCPTHLNGYGEKGS